METLSQSYNRCGQVIEAEDICFQEDNDDNCASSPFHQTQRNQLIVLQEELERYCNELPAFAFKGEKKDTNLIKFYLLTILFRGQNFEPVIFQKSNQYTSCKFGDSQPVDIINLLSWETSLYSFLKAYKTSKAIELLPKEKFDHADQRQNTQLPSYDAFHRKQSSVVLDRE